MSFLIENLLKKDDPKKKVEKRECEEVVVVVANDEKDDAKNRGKRKHRIPTALYSKLIPIDFTTACLRSVERLNFPPR